MRGARAFIITSSFFILMDYGIHVNERKTSFLLDEVKVVGGPRVGGEMLKVGGGEEGAPPSLGLIFPAYW